MKTALDLLADHVQNGGSFVIVKLGGPRRLRLSPEQIFLKEMGYIKHIESKPTQKREGGPAYWRRMASRQGRTNTYIVTTAGHERLAKEGYKFT